MITVFFNSKKPFASANPIPDAPPVIKTVLSFNFMVISLVYRAFLSHPPNIANQPPGILRRLH
jgi:hypothetical protein